MTLNLTLAELMQAVDGKLLRGFPSDRMPIHLETDTRHLQEEQFFVPLKGAAFDGHDFLYKAAELGAIGALIQGRRTAGLDLDRLPGIVVEVNDPLKAYQQAATFLRKKWGGRLIAVTGSSGKTSVKEMIASILSSSHSPLKTEVNENNEIGVPKTLLKLNPTHGSAVIEMGMRGTGQIRELAEIAWPDIAVITNVGLAHVEKLGSPRSIMEAKKEILSALPPHGKGVIPSESPWFKALTEGLKPDQILSFGFSEQSRIFVEQVEMNAQGSHFLLCLEKKKIPIVLPLAGKHHLSNALAAAAAAYAFGADFTDIKNGLEHYRPLEGRGTHFRLKHRITLIDDSYNANPDSMAAGLHAYSMQPGYKIVLMGDMLELGDYAEEAHRKIGELAGSLGFDNILTVGNYRNELIKGIHKTPFPKNQIFSFDSNAEALEYLLDTLKEGDHLFVKASHGQHLEDVVKELMIRLQFNDFLE